MNEPTPDEKIEIAAFTLILGLLMFFVILSVVGIFHVLIWGWP